MGRCRIDYRARNIEGMLRRVCRIFRRVQGPAGRGESGLAAGCDTHLRPGRGQRPDASWHEWMMWRQSLELDVEQADPAYRSIVVHAAPSLRPTS